MITITPEERAEWRAMCTPPSFDFEYKILRLLDALEEAEAERNVLAARLAQDDVPCEEWGEPCPIHTSPGGNHDCIRPAQECWLFLARSKVSA